MLSFQLPKEFVNQYSDRVPPFGFNGLGMVVFLRTYSRPKSDGTMESWADVCERVINGMYSIQKDHALENGRPWSEEKALRSATEAYDRMFNLKWTPSGRGLWMCGTPFVHERRVSEALLNCALITTEDIDQHRGDIFRWFMEMLMLGVGVGSDMKGSGKVIVRKPSPSNAVPYIIGDSREAWAKSVELLINSYIPKGGKVANEVNFDYSRIRPEGEPIKGFGGIASGPAPLIELHDRIREYMNRNDGRPLTSRTIADIFNAIGACVVSGNVRRCLPEDSPVKTDRGYIPIKDVEVGDLVVTAKGNSRVTNKFDQGVQDTIRIKHYFGEFECTPNHKVAVFTDTASWEFKQAKDIAPGDRLVYDPSVYPGSSQELPSRYGEKNPNDTRGTHIAIPELDTEVAWLLGLIAGDGYVFIPSETAKTPNGMVSIACDGDNMEIVDRAMNALSLFGVNPKIKKVRGENCVKVEVYNYDFAKWLHQNVKQAKEELAVPKFISENTVDVRSAWLAGLFDADGCSKNRPLCGVSTVYASFAEEVKLMYNGIGIGAHIRTIDRSGDGWQDIHYVSIKGMESIEQFNNTVARYSSKYESKDIAVSRNSFSYPGKFFNRNSSVSSWRIDQGDKPPVGLPVAVLSVSAGRTVHTYDIEVEDIHQFTADGIVCHNSAEILFGDFDDDEFINLKNYEVNPDRQEIGWVSNNSLFAEIGSPYRKVAENIMRNGEPGFAWMENVRKYARVGDLKEDNADGFNPCKPLYSLILTPDGYITFDQALDRSSLRVVLPDGRVANASRPFKTGENREIIRIGLSDGTSIYATDNHLHMLLNGEWVETGSLKVGDVLKRSVVPVFDTSVDDVSRYEKGIVAGWIYGDGSVHKPSDRSSLVYQIYIGKNEFDFEDELSRMLGVDFRPHDQRPDTCKVARLHGNSHISWMIDEGYDLNKGNLTWLYGKDKDFKLGFIRGLFTTDGSVRRGNLVELYSVNREALEVVARILQEFGIVSNLTTHNRERSYVAKDGKVRNNKTTYKIAVHGGQFKKIGFLTSFKQDLLDSHEEKESLRSADRLVVKEIEREYSYEDVYDITVHDHSHSFIDSSVVAHNCGEIALSGQREMCLLVEVYMNNHDDFYDYLRTLKFAYLYAKSISLTYEWISDPISRETMTSNRRIGLSNTGMAQFMSRNGVEKFIEWLDGGYDYVQHYDARYSGWLGVNRSIRTTTSKPSGSVSLLSGSTPGVHHPISEYYIRRVRLQSSSPLLAYLADCGFKTEADLYSDNTSVVEFPVHVGEGIKKEGDLSIWEQLEIAALVQRYWSDNSVSVTVKVDTDKVDADELARALSLYQYRLKSVSLLPTDKGAYEQMPYEEITKEQYDEMVSRIDFDKMNRIEKIMSGGAVAEEDKVTELYCTTDVCELPQMSS